MGHTVDWLSQVCLRHGFAGHGLEVELVRLAVYVDADVRAVQDFAVEDLDGERVLDHALQGALERTRAVGRIGAGGQDELARGLGEFERDGAVFKQLAARR